MQSNVQSPQTIENSSHSVDFFLNYKIRTFYEEKKNIEIINVKVIARKSQKVEERKRWCGKFHRKAAL